MAQRETIAVDENNFDERAYLVANRDIADYVGAGHEAWSHFAQHGRAEARRQSAPHALQDILFLQTCDAFKYPAMLSATSQTAIEFCRRKGYSYEMFVGLKRGFWSWHAIYNRIPMLKEKTDSGFRGWIVYMDADAYITDLNFDLHDFLDQRAHHAGVFVPALPDCEAWNINDGVFMINLGHEQGRRIVYLWYQAFAALSDDWLRAQRTWSEGHNDQDMIQEILRVDPLIAAEVLIDRTDTINSTTASFIRQALRANFDDFGSRLAWLRRTTNEVFEQDGEWVPWQGPRG
jgi:hypothetical protein